MIRLRKPRWDELVVLAGASGILAFLFFGRHRGLGYFDASEFSLVLRAGGLAHAPGYPLYTLLGRALNCFGLDPFLAQHLISLLALPVAAFALHRSLRGTPAATRAALLTVLLFFSAPANKLYTVLPDVFILNLALFSILGWALKKWFESDDSRDIFFVSLIYGLGLSHHHLLALTLPSFALLALKKGPAWREPNFYVNALTGFLLGALPVLYLFNPLPNSQTQYTYYFVHDLKDFFFVLLRRGYGTLSLYTGSQPTSKGMTVAFILHGLLKNLAYAGVLAFWPLLAWRRRRTERGAADPLLLYAYGTLITFFIVFVARNNIPLDSPHLKSIFARFLTVPSFLLLYPVARGLEIFLESPPPRWVYPSLLGALILSNFVGPRAFDFSRDDLMDQHVRLAYRTIFSDPSLQPVATGSRFYKCAVFVDGDATTYGVKYFNQFESEKSCFIFTLVSFSGAFRSRFEEDLQRNVFGGDYAKALAGLDEPSLLAELFRRLERLGFKLYLFPTPVATPFDGKFFELPRGNVIELLSQLPQISSPDFVAAHEAYLREVVEALRGSVPGPLVDETAGPALFSNVENYRKIDSRSLRGQSRLLELEAEVKSWRASSDSL